MGVPERRDAAGLDKVADLAEYLSSHPLLGGVLVVGEVGAGPAGVQQATFAHPLGRPYVGAFPVGADGVNAAYVATVQPQAYHPKQAAREGVDVAKRVKVAYNGVSLTVPVTWWVF